MRIFRLATLLCLTALSAWGCAAVPVLMVGDVLNAAEVGKTGIDMAAGLNTRRSIEQDTSPDAQAEARLRAVLHAQGGLLARATPHVTQGYAYVVGTYANARELERARAATRNIKGVREITLCLFPAGSGQGNQLDVSDGEVRDNILRMSGVRTRDVRVQVVEGNAVLLGQVRTPAERELLARSAHDAGAATVRNYVRLMAAR